MWSKESNRKEIVLGYLVQKGLSWRAFMNAVINSEMCHPRCVYK